MPPIGGADELSAEELDYLENGGRSEITTTAEPSTPAAPATPAVVDPAAPATPAETDEDEGLEVIEVKEGRARGRDGKWVSHRALHAEREKHKTTRAENARLNADLARAHERVAIINEAIKGNPSPAAAAAPATPAADADPFKEADIDPNVDLFAATAQERRRNAFLYNSVNGERSQRAVVDVETRRFQSYEQDQARYSAVKPDYGDAVKHLVKGRQQELALLGITDLNAQIAQINIEEKEILAQAERLQKSPAEVLYTMAVSRGYVPAAAPATTPQLVKPAAPSAAVDKVRQLQHGQNASASLSSAGSAPNPTLKAEAILDMSDEQFNAFVSTLSKSEQRALLGD